MKSTIALCFLAVLLAAGKCKDLVKNSKLHQDIITHSSIDILVVIDSDSLIDNYKSKSPSQDPSQPTTVTTDYAHMLTSINHEGVMDQASSYLTIQCKPGDIINWYGVSVSNNYNNQIIVYSINHDSKLLTETTMITTQTENIVVVNNNITEIESITMKTNVISLNVIQNTESHSSNENVRYTLNFAVYATGERKKRELFGYFTWDSYWSTILIRH